MFNIVKNQFLGHFFVYLRRHCSNSCDSSGQVYDSILESAMNKQINRELRASHGYFALGQHFLHTNIGRYGFGEYFLNQSSDELMHARAICDYTRKRGGVVQIHCIDEPKVPRDLGPLDAVKASLDTEYNLLNCLTTLHTIANQCNDISALDYIGGTLIKDQVEEIHQLKVLMSKLGQIDTDIGLYLIDRELLKQMKETSSDVSP